MKKLLLGRRRSGILAHITSLPSPYGIGDIGRAAYDFLDFLAESGQSCWQFLPLSPTNPLFDNSPYMSTSAFAGSPLLISPDLLYESGLIDQRSLSARPEFSRYLTDYREVDRYKAQLLAEAFTNFNPDSDPAFATFCAAHPWLEDYALFMAMREHHNQAGWFDWPKKIAARDGDELRRQQETHAERVQYYRFEQYVFSSQWQLLRRRARERNILLFGDIPIYVGLDSVDVWAHQEIFSLNRRSGKPTHVAGVPPDYFSETGQRWGNPLYRWNSRTPAVQDKLLDWWCERFRAVFELVDIARIDHFRGFETYWSIPAENETAIDGKWQRGPGAPFFAKIEKRLGPLDIVAEDLGMITPEVHKLRDQLGFPGMKVLQFAFDGDPANSFLPHNFTTANCIVYTGTHDNDTTLGWFLDSRMADSQRATIKRMANRALHDTAGIHRDMIYLAQSSIGTLSIIPLQDVLGFGNDCRMNSPGIAEGNWVWRCAGEFLTAEIKEYLKSQTTLFGRAVPPATTDTDINESPQKREKILILLLTTKGAVRYKHPTLWPHRLVA